MAIEGNIPGFLDEFEPQNRVHRDRVTCNNLPPHVLGAEELGRYLHHYMNELLKKSAGGNASAADDLFSKSAGGICFFPMG